MIIRQKWGKAYPVTKSRSDPDVVVALTGDKTYNSSGALQSTASSQSVITRRHSESIVYTGGMPGHTRQGANFCVHKKYTRQYTGLTSAPAQVNTLPPGGLAHTDYFSTHKTLAETNHTLAEAEFLAQVGVTSGVGLLYANGLGWINQAVIDLAPDLKKFSLPNDLLDWKQLGSLVTMWNRTSSLVTNLGKQHLGYKFGIKPLAGDMLALLDGVLGLKRELERFRNRQGRIINSRKTVLNDTTIKLGQTTFAPYGRKAWRGQIDRRVHAYMVYQPMPILALNEIDLQLRALLTITGIELNPSIIWDYLRFSFVIDWFVNVGDFLEQFRHKALELPIQILVTYLQYKERVQVNSWTNFTSDVNQAVTPKETAGTWSVSELFHRYPIKPDYATFASLKVKWPTANQALLAVSLGAALGGNHINRFLKSTDAVTGQVKRYYDYSPE